MITNIALFFISIACVSTATLIALKLGKQALIALICVQVILVNLFVSKEIILFGFTATSSDSLAVGITLGFNLLQEYFGRLEAQKTIWVSFFCSLFYTSMSLLQVAYIPTALDTTSEHFEALLSPMPRVIGASLIVFLIVQQLDTRLYAFLSTRLKNRFFILRNYSSVAITQFVDTVLFSFLGLYKLNGNFDSLTAIFEIIVISYTIKLIVIAVAAPFLALSKKIIHH
ncbi:queuosine precursor transporter [Candidatus Dependentiae bacterium]|nr:queuosine precursor transporter [Candidatus Dependentiae bacterium]